MTKAHEWFSVRRVATAAALAAVVGGSASAQNASEVTVAVRGGMQSFDKSASLDNAFAFGLDVMYGANPWLSWGPSLTLTRANTTGEHFVAAITYGLLSLGDTTSFFKASQPVNVLDGALNVKVRLQGNTFQPYATGGIGGWLLVLDTQANRGAGNRTGLAFNFGGGVSYSMSDRAGIVLDVRGTSYTDYDRQALDPRNLVPSRIENTLFAEDWEAPPKDKKTVTNFTFSLGFTYIPALLGGGGGGGGRGSSNRNSSGGNK